VRGDRDVKYEQVVYVMTLLQKAGAESVGLMTDPALVQGQAASEATRR
jgi:biopolymer transport protein ExbD